MAVKTHSRCTLSKTQRNAEILEIHSSTEESATPSMIIIHCECSAPPCTEQERCHWDKNVACGEQLVQVEQVS